ncbi:uncharacterized protein LOC131684906 [Topomyia yanbarensis]|uniref:uncharacterized protein LOC131684906 n=1 Tax=Topomyia yanbarensis TaxID=2498891 RepID=UPI00273B4C04|nr:uncharacterized protein LOC131684906 [Topomyia yanbarensis]
MCWKRTTYLCSFLFFVSITLPTHLLASSAENETETEQGRFLLWGRPILIVPPTSPTRHQLISGIGVPLSAQESITFGWVFKAQYFLPTQLSNLRPNLWAGWNDTRRSLEKREAVTMMPDQHYEKYTATDVKVETEQLPDEEEAIDGSDEYDDDFEDGDDNYWLDEEEEKKFQEVNDMHPPADTHPPEDGYSTEHSRWTAYKVMEKMGESYGFGGRACMLRSICEAAAAEFTHTGGVFAELFHIVFTPSTTAEPLSEHRDNEYYRAEQLGREGAPCKQVFQECKNTILDVFTGVHDPVTNALDVAHNKLRQAIMK